MIWVCILCRKKQELLIKTGTWMQSTAEMSTDPILRRMEQDMAATPTSSVPPHHRERLRLSEGGGGDGSNMSTPMNHPLRFEIFGFLSSQNEEKYIIFPQFVFF